MYTNNKEYKFNSLEKLYYDYKWIKCILYMHKFIRFNLKLKISLLYENFKLELHYIEQM